MEGLLIAETENRLKDLRSSIAGCTSLRTAIRFDLAVASYSLRRSLEVNE